MFLKLKNTNDAEDFLLLGWSVFLYFFGGGKPTFEHDGFVSHFKIHVYMCRGKGGACTCRGGAR